MADRAYITPEVLKWARETAKISEESAASKASVSIDKVKEWETGKSYPTIRQAQILAKAYKRPFSIFFLPEIPLDFQPLQDFRKRGSKELNTASIFIIREIQQKQQWISDINKENDEPAASFVGIFSKDNDPQTVAKDILSTLGINPLNYTTNNPILEWIDRAEAKGIFISRTSFIHSRLKLDSDEIQGFAIADPYAPFVFVNSDDWNSPQLFTLVHELVHIWISESGISNDTEPVFSKRTDIHPIELFCNEVTANALIPHEFITDIDKQILLDAKALFRMAKKIGVSSFALLVRALKLNLISLSQYKQTKKDAEVLFREFVIREEEKKAKQKEKPGGPDPYLLKVNRNSRLFTQTVLDAYRGGNIEPTMASNLLNTQVNKFSKLEARLY